MPGSTEVTWPASARATSITPAPEVIPDINGVSVRVGATLRRKRKEFGLTLAEAAERVGISASQLSRMERAEQHITVVELMTFATLYNCSVTEYLLTEDVRPVKVTRRRDRVRVIRNVTKEGKVVAEQLSNAAGQRIEPSLIFMPPNSDSGDPLSHDGDEFLTVIDGALRVWVGETVTDLDQGDTVYYDSAVAHHWINPENRPAVLLMVSCPATVGFNNLVAHS
jgi:transcriptional regulator with XRE-family HTH domain